MKSGTVWAKCWRLALADFGRDLRNSDSLRGIRILLIFRSRNARFHRFPVGQILRHLNTTTSIGEAVKPSEQNFENFTVKGRFFQKSRKNCLHSFQILRLQAVINPQWLQIAENSLPDGPSMRCLVSIFTVRINPNSFPWAVCFVRLRYLPKFSATSDVRYSVLKQMVRCSDGAAYRAIYWKKQTELETENK